MAAPVELTLAEESILDGAAGEAADEQDESGPLRRCIVSRQTLPKDGLIRFVVGPADELVPDVDERLPGRGIWVASERAAVAMAVTKRLFAKAAKQNVVVAGDLPDRVESLLVRRALNQLGLARRAGAVVAGASKVRAWLEAGRVGLLICAVDGAEDGCRKLRSMAGDATIVGVFTSAELSAALGGDNVVHVAVAGGAFADRIGREAGRVSGFRRTK
ncbi:MAG: RNA-binding protein [Pseudomonadota bacterium]